jgi:hypothetical protein
MINCKYINAVSEEGFSDRKGSANVQASGS